MKGYRMTVWASINMQGGNAEETIDLVEDLGFEEESAREFIEAGGEGNKEIEDALAEYAREIINFESGFYVALEDES